MAFVVRRPAGIFQNLKRECYFLGSAFIASFLFFACEAPDKPHDADTRKYIDSLTAVRVREAKTEMDSLCQRQQTTLLPMLVDSIKKVREAEIREALKTVPK